MRFILITTIKYTIFSILLFHNIKITPECEYGPWEEWGPCSEYCIAHETGIRTRKREQLTLDCLTTRSGIQNKMCVGCDKRRSYHD